MTTHQGPSILHNPTSVPSPTSSSVPLNCVSWIRRQAGGESCASLATSAGLSPSEFFQYNPSLAPAGDENCTNDFWRARPFPRV
ncbi:hypothetical protein F5Y16DRAFT_362534 [Xylariaceae sp. FL0255]|nr:hypothetical protein F5Y16DRAFT_362534 [Xylariaceae sp. FL0255]